jgi:hypothetical protein
MVTNYILCLANKRYEIAVIQPVIEELKFGDAASWCWEDLTTANKHLA